ncbi:hypothetical protein V8E55_011742 [Tylopilus felleus]
MSTPTTWKTCASNVHKRLGLPDLPQRRRTSTQKKADNELLSNACAEREAATNQSAQRLNDMETKMKNDQAMAMVNIAKPVHPAPATNKPPTRKASRPAQPQMIGGMEVLPSGRLLNSLLGNEVEVPNNLPLTMMLQEAAAAETGTAGQYKRNRAMDFEGRKPATATDVSDSISQELLDCLDTWATSTNKGKTYQPCSKQHVTATPSPSHDPKGNTTTPSLSPPWTQDPRRITTTASPGPPWTQRVNNTTEPAKLISNAASIASIDSLATANDNTLVGGFGDTLVGGFDDTLVGGFDDEEMEDDILERAAIKGSVFADGNSSQHPSKMVSITIAHDDLPDDIEEVTLSSQKRKLWESKSDIDEEILHNELPSGPRPQDDDENATTSAEAYQHLCDWRHVMGSAGLKAIVVIFSKLAPEKQKSQATAFLNQHCFLYTGWKAGESENTFQSTLVLELLAGHYLSQVKRWIDVLFLDCASLYNHGFKGIMGLCGAALQCALCIMQDGNIQLEVDAKGNLKMPTILNKASGKNWGKATWKLTAAAGRRNADVLLDIMGKACHLTNQSPNADDPEDSEDEYAFICKYFNA